MSRTFRVCFILSLGIIIESSAQTFQYASETSRPIKALSADQVSQYLAGEGMGFARAAELNGYPGPKHVLDLAKELDLATDQVSAVKTLFDVMHENAVRLGSEYVDGERLLDSLFAARTITPEALRTHLDKLGTLTARLRGVHLEAHIKTAVLLTERQRARYMELRGYVAGIGSGEHRMHH